MLPSAMTTRLTASAGMTAAERLWEKYQPSPDNLFYGVNWSDSSEKGMNYTMEIMKQTGVEGTATAGAGGYVRGQGEQTTRFAGIGRPQMKGVDLRLDRFDLTEVKKVQMEAPAGLEKCLALGDAFWSGLKEDSAVFKADDKDLLKDIFCESLSDRRLDGDKFVPPDASHSYVSRLRGLIKEEGAVRRRRIEHFLSEGFVMGSPGSIFPSSWTPAFEIARGRTPVRLPEGRAQETLHRRRDYEKEAALVHEVLKSAPAVFDKSSEDGLRFRIYRIGSLEFRTTQELGGDEKIGVVFSIHTPLQDSKQGKIRKTKTIGDHERVTKVTEYVEKAFSGLVGAGESTFYHRYYLVLETEMENKVLTELLANGKVVWVDNEDFEVRNSLAKATYSVESNNGATVAEMKAFMRKATEDVAKEGISKASCKRYVKAASARACEGGHN